MKVLLLSLILLPLTAYPQGVNLSTGSSQGKYISAFGDASMARAVQSENCSYRDIVLTTAEVDALNATPVEVVPAPGAGKALIPCKAVGWLNYAGTAYAGSSEVINVTYGTAGATAFTFSEVWLESTTDKYQVQMPAANVIPVENAALMMNATVADITTGNSPVSVRVFYQTLGGSTILE